MCRKSQWVRIFWNNDTTLRTTLRFRVTFLKSTFSCSVWTTADCLSMSKSLNALSCCYVIGSWDICRWTGVPKNNWLMALETYRSTRWVEIVVMWLKMLIVSVLSTMEGFFAVVVVTDIVQFWVLPSPKPVSRQLTHCMTLSKTAPTPKVGSLFIRVLV